MWACNPNNQNQQWDVNTDAEIVELSRRWKTTSFGEGVPHCILLQSLPQCLLNATNSLSSS